MQHTLEAVINANQINSIPFESDKEAEIASQALLENWGVGTQRVASNRSLTSNMINITTNGILYSDIFNTKEKALTAQALMLKNWGIQSKLEPYDSEPKDDGYDFDKYN
jgi:hypothetical protein